MWRYPQPILAHSCIGLRAHVVWGRMFLRVLKLPVSGGEEGRKVPRGIWCALTYAWEVVCEGCKCE